MADFLVYKMLFIRLLKPGFLCTVWHSVLSLNNLKITETKAGNNICIQETFILQLTFNPG